GLRPRGAGRIRRAHPLAGVDCQPAGLGTAARPLPPRPGVVVISLLGAQVPELAVRVETRPDRPATRGHVPGLEWRGHLRRLVLRAADGARPRQQRRAQAGHAGVRPDGGADCTGSAGGEPLARDRTDFSRHGGPLRLGGEYFHHRFRYLPQAGGQFGGRDLRVRRGCGRYAGCERGGFRAAGDGQLPHHLRARQFLLPGGLEHHPSDVPPPGEGQPGGPWHVTKTSSRERVLCTLDHRQPDRIPVDFGGTFVSGIHASCVLALRDYFGLEKKPVKVIDPGQFLGEIDEDLKRALGIDTEGIIRRMTRFGFPAEDWKPFRMYDGTEVLVPGQFHVTIDENGDTLMHPLGDTSNPPSARMPNGGYFFDAIIRQQPFDEDHLDPADNLEEYGPVSDEE